MLIYSILLLLDVSVHYFGANSIELLPDGYSNKYILFILPILTISLYLFCYGATLLLYLYYLKKILYFIKGSLFLSFILCYLICIFYSTMFTNILGDLNLFSISGTDGFYSPDFNSQDTNI